MVSLPKGLCFILPNVTIDSTEFLTAAFDKRKLLSEENHKRTFAMLDKESRGNISKDEIKAALGGNDINLP